jgi:hypothetical protein
MDVNVTITRSTTQELLCSGEEQVREGSTIPVKCMGVGSWITGSSVGTL